MSVIRVAMAWVSLASLASACSGGEPANNQHLAAAARSNEQFLDCWQGRAAENGTRLIEFEAVFFPRNGVLSSSSICPELILNMQFRDGQFPEDIVNRDPQSPHFFDERGFKGAAIVSVVSRERPDMLIIRVERLVRRDNLSAAQAQAVVERDRAAAHARALSDPPVSFPKGR